MVGPQVQGINMLIVQFDDQNLHNENPNEFAITTGDLKRVYIVSDEPVWSEMKCFVDNPPPVGFRECPSCNMKQFGETEITRKPKEYGVIQGVVEICADKEFWSDREGSIQLDIRNEGNERVTCRIQVVRTDIRLK